MSNKELNTEVVNEIKNTTENEYATEIDLPNEAILAGTWRKGLGIAGKYRNDQKRNAQKWVFDNQGIKVVEDEADAICIGAYAAGIRSVK
jgi:hypothetical protein